MHHRFEEGSEELEFLSRLANPTARRTFLQWAGITVVATAAGCTRDTLDPTAPATGQSGEDPSSQDHGTDPNEGPITFPPGDLGVLNFAYALEQLEAAFYTRVVASFYSGASSEEKRILTEIMKHEVVHREFLNAALGANAIAVLKFNFSSVDFGSRESVLQTARAFEDLGVAAYNGAARFLSDPNFLLVAGKIVSVEARHAAAIRDLIRPRSRYFAAEDVVSLETGLGSIKRPTRVARIAAPFFRRRIAIRTLPGSDK